MRMRSLLTSAAVVSLAIGSTYVAPSAFAQKGVVLAPQTGWAVTSIEDDGRGTGSYCAMAKRFRNNLILTIAQNNNAESSIALDFAKGNFDTRQYFAVNLDPGGGQNRSYEIRPASRQAFVVRLGRDPAFFQALQKTGFLRTEIGGEIYNFNLADIDSGKQQLDSCVVNSVLPSAGRSAPIPVPSQSVSAPGSADLQNKLADLQSQIEQLQSENRSLSGDIMDERRRVESEVLPVQSPKTEALVERIASLEGENETLRAEIQKRSVPKGVSYKELKELEKLRKDNVALRADLDRLQVSTSQAGALEAEIAALRAENRSMIALANGEKSDVLKKLADANESLQAALREKQKVIYESQGLNERLKDLEAQNAQLRTRVAQVSSIPDHSDELAELSEENKALKKQLGQIKQKETANIAALEAELKSLQTENGDLKGQIDTVRSEVEKKYAEKLARFERENGDLKLSLEQTGLDDQLVEHLRKQIGALEAENQTIKNDVVAKKNKALSEKDSLIAEMSGENESLRLKAEAEQALAEVQKKTIAELEEQLATLKTRNTALKTELTEVKSNVEEHYEQKISRLEIENSELEKVLQKGVASEKARKSLEARLNEIEFERDDLKQKLAQAKADAAEKVRLEAQVAELKLKIQEQDNALLAAGSKAVELEAAKAKIKQAQLQITKTADTIDTLQSAVTGLEEENAGLRQSMKESVEKSKTILDLEVSRLQEDRDQFKQAHEKAKAELERVQAQIAQRDETVGALETTIAKLEAENAELKTSLETTVAETKSSIDQQVAQLRAERTELQSSLSEAQEEAMKVQGLEIDLSTLRQENLEIKQKLASAEKQGATLDTRLQAMIEENAALKADIADKDGKLGLLAELKDTIKGLTGQNKDLTESLAALSTTNDKLQSDIERKKDHLASMESLKGSISDMTLQNQKLVESLQALNFENEKLRSEVEKKNSKIEIVGSARDSLRDQILDLTAKKTTLEQEVAALNTKNDILESSIKTKDQQIETIAGLKEEIKTLSGENAALQVNVEGKIAQIESLNKLTGTVDELSKERAKLSVDLHKLSAENEVLKTQLASRDTQIKNLSSLEGTVKELNGEAAQLEGKLQLMSDQNAKLQSELTAKETQVKELSALEGVVEKLTAETAEQDAKIDELLAQNENLKLELGDKNNQIAAIAGLKMSIQELNTANKDLNDQLQKVLTENTALKSSVQEKDGKIAEILANFKGAVEELTGKNRELTASLQSSESNVAVLRAENMQLKETLKTREAAYVNAKMLQERLGKLESLHTKVSSALQSLEAEAEKYKKTIALQAQEIAQLKEDKQDLKAMLVKDQQGQIILGLQEEIELLHDENRTLAQQLEKNNFFSVSAGTKSSSDLRAENASLRAKIKAMSEANTSGNQKMLDEINSEYGRIKRELKTLRAQEKATPINYTTPKAEAPAKSIMHEVKAPIPAPRPKTITARAQTQPEPVQMEKPVQQASLSDAQKQEVSMLNTMKGPKVDDTVTRMSPVMKASLNPAQGAGRVIPASLSAIEPAAGGQSGSRIAAVLDKAGVPYGGSITVAEARSNGEKTVYLWNAQNVYGSAEQRSIRNTGAEFDEYVREYLETTQLRCPGEFAAMPNYTSPVSGDLRVDSYEIACVAGSVTSSATLVFYSEDNIFTALAHEADTREMAAAMEIRDRLVRAITGSAG